VSLSTGSRSATRCPPTQESGSGWCIPLARPFGPQRVHLISPRGHPHIHQRHECLHNKGHSGHRRRIKRLLLLRARTGRWCRPSIAEGQQGVRRASEETRLGQDHRRVKGLKDGCQGAVFQGSAVPNIPLEPGRASRDFSSVFAPGPPHPNSATEPQLDHHYFARPPSPTPTLVSATPIPRPSPAPQLKRWSYPFPTP